MDVELLSSLNKEVAKLKNEINCVEEGVKKIDKRLHNALKSIRARISSLELRQTAQEELQAKITERQTAQEEEQIKMTERQTAQKEELVKITARQTAMECTGMCV